MPAIARWPGKIRPGTTTDQTFCLTDIMATLATLVGYDLPADAAEDSYDFSPLLAGTQGVPPVREFTLHQTNRLELAIRVGPWKYLDHAGSGGNDYNRPQLAGFAIDDGAPGAPAQLYNLAEDPGETKNLYFDEPERVATLKAKLDSLVAAGRSVSRR